MLTSQGVTIAAIVLCLLLAVWAMHSHRAAKASERGGHPRWSHEVYWACGEAARDEDTREDTREATPAMVETYFREGGAAAARGCRALYGPKPVPGTGGVLPFSGAHWFQP